MKNKILIIALILATSTTYSETFYNNNGEKLKKSPYFS